MDTCVEPLENDPLEVDNVMVQLADRTQKWTNILDVVAQSTDFHKCWAQIFSYALVKSSLKIDFDSRHNLSLIDLKGARSKIAYLPPDKPNNGPGFKQASNSNQGHNF